MIFTWQHLINIVLSVQLCNVVGQSYFKTNPPDWKVAESLAEQHPFVVALLNRTKEYMCTGIIISKATVLTSGSCIDPALHYIAVATAVLSKNISNRSLFDIASSKLHSDYRFELKVSDPNITQVHSNIGLVFSAIPKLEVYVSHADLGNYFASELKEREVKVVGYGQLPESNVVVLQHQTYLQTPCPNPKWYYCICGYEDSISTVDKTYEDPFGKGAPVFLGHELIGVAATPCGMLNIPSTSSGQKYNIFTVLGPYLAWIQNNHSNFSKKINFRAKSTGHRNTGIQFVYISLMFSKVIQ